MSSSFSILIAEPNMLMREKISGVLSRDKDVWGAIQVDGKDGLVRGAAQFKPDLILANWVFLNDQDLVSTLRTASTHSRILGLVDAMDDAYEDASKRMGLDGVLDRGHIADLVMEEVLKLADVDGGLVDEAT